MQKKATRIIKKYSEALKLKIVSDIELAKYRICDAFWEYSGSFALKLRIKGLIVRNADES